MAVKKKCIVIYTEGETECEFYDCLLEEIKDRYSIKKFNVDRILKRCLKGITKFDKKLLKKFEYEVKSKYPDYEIIVFLCYDTDVFEYSAKPPVDWNKVDSQLKKLGANKVVHLKAERCIEDIFLIDIEDICRFLKIGPIKTIAGASGVDKIKNLFCKGNRIYQKGFLCEGFVKALNMSLILERSNNQFNSLIDELVEDKKQD